MWPKSVTPMAGRLEQFAWMRRRPLMPLALKHSWGGKRRERRIALCHYRPPAALTRTLSSGGAEGGGFPPGPAAPHLVLGEAELRHPLSHFLGAPGQEGEDGTWSPRALGLRLRPFSRSRPRGTRARLHRLHPRPPRQRVFSGPCYLGNHRFLQVLPLLPSATPSLLSACIAARAPRLCRTKRWLAALSRGEAEG